MYVPDNEVSSKANVQLSVENMASTSELAAALAQLTSNSTHVDQADLNKLLASLAKGGDKVLAAAGAAEEENNDIKE